MNAHGSSYRYLVGGVTVESELSLPGLVETDAVPDVAIRLSGARLTLEAPTLRGVLFVADQRGCLITAPGVARYLVEDGRSILVEPLAGATPEAVRLFLLGAAMGMVLCQRGLLVWHASAVAGADGGAVIFAGHSGRGKSTIGAAMVRRGWRFLSDDLTVVTTDSLGSPRAEPTFPRLKLRPDTARALGWDLDSLVPVRPGGSKLLVGADEAFVPAALPIRRIYVIDYGSPAGVHIRSVSGHDRFERLRPYLFGQKYVEHRRIHVRQFAAYSAAVTTAAVRILSRPTDAPVDAVVDAILADGAL